MEKNYLEHNNIETNDQLIELLWEESREGVRILRVYGNYPVVVLPDEIEGKKITEIGPYCFSESERGISDNAYLTSVETQSRLESPSYPSVSGNFAEEITLPDSVTTLHNAAFYNCRKLRELSVGKKISSIGSDEFTNCNQLKHLIIRCEAEDESGLQLILERIKTDIEVIFGAKDAIDSVLLFPEYYEWLDEIGPAHIFSRAIEGEGFRMRQAFTDRRLDFQKYDQCFSNAIITESEKTLCHIARNRLQWPTELKEEYQNLYEKVLREKLEVEIKETIKEKQMERLQFLYQYFQPKQNLLGEWLQMCIASDWSEGAAFIMKERKQKQSFAQKSFDL